MTPSIWRTVAVGVIATVAMDVLSVAAARVGLAAPLSPNLIGRWFVSVARAQPVHADIARAVPASHEGAIVFPVHYAIGVSLAALYVWATLHLGWPARSLSTSIAFGLCTNVLPWLLMFPAMGYGAFGAHGPAGTRLFVSSLISHACFGLGLWIGARMMLSP
jgi:hypothetical protein